jgi:hypothetical protein
MKRAGHFIPVCSYHFVIAVWIAKERESVMKTAMPRFLIAVLIVCFGSVKSAQAVSPPPDGGYSGNNTAEGQDALLSLTTGVNNTAVGWFSLKSNKNAQYNTAVGSATLFSTVGRKPKHSHWRGGAF